MYTVYANKGQGWEYQGDFKSLFEVASMRLSLENQGYKVEVASPNDPVEREIYD